jgi:hypothetical protein
MLRFPISIVADALRLALLGFLLLTMVGGAAGLYPEYLHVTKL